MPVVQKTGPDGCLYVLDWYDRYHCYQDAGRDPEGHRSAQGPAVSRALRRHAARRPFDLARKATSNSSRGCTARMSSYRDLAQRLLAERNRAEATAGARAPGARRFGPRTARMHALWALVGSGRSSRRFIAAAGPCRSVPRLGRPGGRQFRGKCSREIVPSIRALAADPSPDVRLQVAIAAGQADRTSIAAVLTRSPATVSDDDPLIPHIVWQNLHPIVEDHARRHSRSATQADCPARRRCADLCRGCRTAAGRASIRPRVASFSGWLSAAPTSSQRSPARHAWLDLAKRDPKPRVRRRPTAARCRRIRPGARNDPGRPGRRPLHLAAALGATLHGDPAGSDAARKIYLAASDPDGGRREALEALVACATTRACRDARGRRPAATARIARFARPDAGFARSGPRAGVATWRWTNYRRFEPSSSPQAIELLTGGRRGGTNCSPRSAGGRSRPRR